MSTYPIPLKEIRLEQRVVNSRFIATLGPAFSVEEAKQFISRIRREFADASHNVPAYCIGHGASEISHCSDDGEPSGTAGRPALSVLRGSGLGDVSVVVTRYFGGTKLGTGGLVRAYSDAVRQVVEAVPRGVKIHVHLLLLAIPYNLLERLRLLVAQHQGEILEETFAADITLTLRLPTQHTPAFQASLQELSAGQLSAEIMEEAVQLIPLTGELS
ncbi:MAG: YigZ family protein [Anaerolineales bacterium]|nr:YigZ family protein [Anaerolineales bacterium]